MQIAFKGATCDELFGALLKHRNSRSVRDSGCYYQYVEKDRYELVDTFDEPGRITQDQFWSYWEPGVYFADDATARRFHAMELT